MKLEDEEEVLKDLYNEDFLMYETEFHNVK